MNIPRKLVLWILGGIVICCISYGCYKATTAMNKMMAKHLRMMKKEDVGLGYTPPPSQPPKEVKDE